MRVSPFIAAGIGALAAAVAPFAGAAETRPWPEILAKAKGQTVYWNAWGGDDRNNAYIAWVGEEVKRRFGVTLNHVKLTDTAEAVTRVVAEKAAGRTEGGTVDLIWINGANLASMKAQNLLHGPFTAALPNFARVDTKGKPSTVIDFTLPVDGMASPWLMAQIVYVYDSARSKPAELPHSIPAMLEWSKRNPGRLTHPTVSNFLGATFLKQALYELAPDPAILQQEATDTSFAEASAPLWAWYDALRPNLWHKGKDFPESGPAMRQLLADGEIDLMISFNPAEAVLSSSSGLLPAGRARPLAGEGHHRQHQLRRHPVQRRPQGGRDGRGECPARSGGAGPRPGPDRHRSPQRPRCLEALPGRERALHGTPSAGHAERGGTRSAASRAPSLLDHPSHGGMAEAVSALTPSCCVSHLP